MFSLGTNIFFGLILLLVVVVLVLLFFKIKRNKSVILQIPPDRLLSSEDLAAIKFLEIDGNLMVDLLPVKMLPKKDLYKKIWKFSDVDFIIETILRGRQKLIYRFHLAINGVPIEIVIPEIFLPYLTEGFLYQNKTIEILYQREHFILFSVDGIISYPSLYEKFQLEQKSLSRRKPTKAEMSAFALSKWTSVWGIILPFIVPFLIIGVIEEGPWFSLVFAPFILITVVPFYFAYKKRKKYIDAQMIHTVKGQLWYDEMKYVYRIEEEELKLHRKWKKQIKKTTLPIKNVTMEAFLHSYDNLEQTVHRKFQPISIQSDHLNLNENNLKSTRSWAVPFLYFLSCLSVALIAPSYAISGNIIVDPRNLEAATGNLLFAGLMTLVWWAFIIATIYLGYLVLTRIKSNYFSS